MSIIPKQNLVGYWPLDGYSVDRSGNNNHGTVTGALPVPSQNPAIPASLAYKFNGTSDKIETASNPTYGTTGSISFWFNLSSLSAQQIIGSDSSGIDIQLSSSSLYARLYKDGGFINTSANIKINNWYHCVFNYGGSVNELYLNGARVASGTSTNTPTAGKLRLGQNTAGGGFYGGKLQDVALFNKALSAQEIQAIYSQSKRKYVGLTAKIMGVLGTVYSLALAQGSYATTGYNIAFIKFLNMAISFGSYVTTGYDMIFSRARGMFIEAGSYITTGYSIGFSSLRSISIQAGSYVTNGYDILMEKVRGIRFESGNYITTFFDVIRPQRWQNKSKSSSIWTNKDKG